MPSYPLPKNKGKTAAVDLVVRTIIRTHGVVPNIAHVREAARLALNLGIEIGLDRALQAAIDRRRRAQFNAKPGKVFRHGSAR